MARIPDEEIERLKQEIPIERLVTGFGIELKRQGKDLFGRCPFHDDRTKEQQQLDKQGGVKNTDNKRNEKRQKPTSNNP